MAAMTIHHIKKDFSQYTFAPKNQAHWGINVFALEAQGRVLLIDTGYAEYGKRLRDGLHRRRLSLDIVGEVDTPGRTAPICSH